MILRQCNLRLKPEFRFPIRALHVHVTPWLFSGEEVKPILAVTKDGRTQCLSLRDRGLSRHLTSAISGGAQSARRLLIEAFGCHLQSLQAA